MEKLRWKVLDAEEDAPSEHLSGVNGEDDAEEDDAEDDAPSEHLSGADGGIKENFTFSSYSKNWKILSFCSWEILVITFKILTRIYPYL